MAGASNRKFRWEIRCGHVHSSVHVVDCSLLSLPVTLWSTPSVMRSSRWSMTIIKDASVELPMSLGRWRIREGKYRAIFEASCSPSIPFWLCDDVGFEFARYRYQIFHLIFDRFFVLFSDFVTNFLLVEFVLAGCGSLMMDDGARFGVVWIEGWRESDWSSEGCWLKWWLVLWVGYGCWRFGLWSC